MKKNVGSQDKIIRLIVAVILTVLLITGVVTGGLAVAAIVVAAILLVTSLVNFCPLYALLGTNTCKVK